MTPPSGEYPTVIGEVDYGVPGLDYYCALSRNRAGLSGLSPAQIAAFSPEEFREAALRGRLTYEEAQGAYAAGPSTFQQEVQRRMTGAVGRAWRHDPATDEHFIDVVTELVCFVVGTWQGLSTDLIPEGFAGRGLGTRPAGISARLYQPSRFATRTAGISALLYNPRQIRAAGQRHGSTTAGTPEVTSGMSYDDCVAIGAPQSQCNALPDAPMNFGGGEGETPGGTSGQLSAYDRCVADGGTSCDLVRDVDTGGKTGQYTRPTQQEATALQWVTGIGGLATGLLGTILTYDQRNQAMELQRRQQDATNETNRLRLQSPTANASQIAALQAQITANQQSANDLAASIRAVLQAQAGVGMPVWGWALLGVAGLVAVGGGVYVLTSRRPRE
jgi:hypothetical protein